MIIIIKGAIPSKKNSKQILVNRSTGRRFISSSNAFKTWHTSQLYQLPTLPHPIIHTKKIIFTLYPADYRKRDLSNAWESVGDLLVDKHILIDDNTSVIPKLILQLGWVDKKNPRAEIEIKFG